MVKINGVEYLPELPYEFIEDGTEEFDKGTFNLDNSTQEIPFEDYANISVIINSKEYKFVQESDLPNRVSKGKTRV